jgi:hypothetical protein
MVSFTPPPPEITLHTHWIRGSQRQSGHCGEEKNLALAIQPVVRHYIERANPIPKPKGTRMFITFQNVERLGSGEGLVT